MLTFLLIALSVAAVWFCVWFFYFRPLERKKKLWYDLDHLGIPRTYCYFKHRYTTPNGVRITSTVPVPADAMDLVEDGIMAQIRRHNAAHPNWQRFKNLADYAVVFIDPMGESVETLPGAPTLTVMGVQTAGTCIGVAARARADQPTIVLPHQDADAWRFEDYLMRSAWHESEHVREFVNDHAVFLQYIGAGDVHPHIP